MSEVARGIAAMGWKTSDGQPISREPPFGVTVLVWRRGEPDREWLVLHRAHEGPDYEGEWAWGPPAGARLPGESLVECGQRELREETGLTLELHATACGTPDWAVFLAEAAPDSSIVLSAEHDAFLWLPLEVAAKRCLPAEVGDSITAAAAALGN